MNYDFDKSIGKLTQQISKKIGANLEKKFVENGISLKATDWSAIAMLYKHGKRNQRDIAIFMGLDKVRIKRTIDRLEKDKLVFREESKVDKRFNIIVLTSAGKKIYKQLVPYAEEAILDAFKGILPDDISKCLNVLDKIKDNLIEK